LYEHIDKLNLHREGRQHDNVDIESHFEEQSGFQNQFQNRYGSDGDGGNSDEGNDMDVWSTSNHFKADEDPFSEEMVGGNEDVGNSDSFFSKELNSFKDESSWKHQAYENTLDNEENHRNYDDNLWNQEVNNNNFNDETGSSSYVAQMIENQNGGSSEESSDLNWSNFEDNHGELSNHKDWGWNEESGEKINRNNQQVRVDSLETSDSNLGYMENNNEGSDEDITANYFSTINHNNDNRGWAEESSEKSTYNNAESDDGSDWSPFLSSWA